MGPVFLGFEIRGRETGEGWTPETVHPTVTPTSEKPVTGQEGCARGGDTDDQDAAHWP